MNEPGGDADSVWSGSRDLSIESYIRRALLWRMFAMMFPLAIIMTFVYFTEGGTSVGQNDLLALVAGTLVSALISFAAFGAEKLEVEDKYPLLSKEAITLPETRWIGWWPSETLPWERIREIELKRAWGSPAENHAEDGPSLALSILGTDGRRRDLFYIGATEKQKNQNGELEHVLRAKWDSLRR